MADIIYTKGDATNPISDGNKLIVHICNDIGKWGKGFVMAISKRWPNPEKSYKQWYKSQKDFELGNIQAVQVENDTWVINMIGQHKINKDENGNAPIRYNAVAAALDKVKEFAMKHNASVHMPRIGCGLAGGKWENIEPLIINTFVQNNIQVNVYDF